VKILLTILCLGLGCYASAQDAFFYSNKRTFDLNKNQTEYVVRSSGTAHNQLVSDKANWTATSITDQLSLVVRKEGSSHSAAVVSLRKITDDFSPTFKHIDGYRLIPTGEVVFKPKNLFI
jgi:hypothetical protein